MIHNGNNLEVLKTFADNSVDSVVTDPPYGLSFMGKAWDYDVPKADLWREVLRVLKPGGHLLSFFGTRTYHRGVVAIEDAGFEIRDQIGWAYGSGFPKSHDVSKGIDKAKGTFVPGEITENSRSGVEGDDGGFDHSKVTRAANPQSDEAKRWKGWGTALKPAWEPICVARKPFRGTVAENVMEHGTGAINIDGCRINYVSEYDKKHQEDIRKGNGTFFGGSGVSKSEQIDMIGRWPANLIHDGSEEVLQAFPSAPGQCGLAKTDGSPQGNKIYGAMKHGTKNPEPRIEEEKSAARFFYCAKTSKADREEGLDGFKEKQYSHDGRQTPIDNAYQRNSNSNHHPTVKPTALMRYLCRLVTPPQGIVLDPFMGSGSTGKAAALEGFGFIGIELDPEYCRISEARIGHVLREEPAIACLNTGRNYIGFESNSHYVEMANRRILELNKTEEEIW